MPELPEVETVVKELNKKARGKKIKGIWSDHPKMVRDLSLIQFKNRLIGKKIISIKRRAKNILIELDSGETLWIHLKMTGHLLLKPKRPTAEEFKIFNEDKYNTYIHFIFYFTDGTELAFTDLRKFGRLRLIKAQIKEIIKGPEKFGLDKFGPEPFSGEFNFNYLKQIFKGKKRPIKLVLMDQAMISGIGNIYASEILFDAKINPKREAQSLTEKEIKKIISSTRKILKKAIELKGTSVSDFRDLHGKKGKFGQALKVYQRSFKKCFRCASMVKRIKQGQRSTFYCSACQK